MTLPPRTITPVLGVAALALFALNFHRYIDHLWNEHEARHAFTEARDTHIHMWHSERDDYPHRHRLYLRPEPGGRAFRFEVPPADGPLPSEPLRFKIETRRHTRDIESIAREPLTGATETIVLERITSNEL